MATVAPAPSPPTADRILFSIFSSGSVLFSRFLAFSPSGSDCVYGVFLFIYFFCADLRLCDSGLVWIHLGVSFYGVFIGLCGRLCVRIGLRCVCLAWILMSRVCFCCDLFIFCVLYMLELFLIYLGGFFL